MNPVLHSLLGFVALHALAWGISENRRQQPWRTVISGMLLTFLLALILLKAPYAKHGFAMLNDALGALERAARDGTSFVFGYLGGGPVPFPESYPAASFVLAFRALPLVVVVSALSALLFHWRVLPPVVRLFSALLRKIMGVSGAVGLSSAANVFVGMVEAPLVVKPYIGAMTRSELFVLMTCGMATVAGTVMALYASVLAGRIPDALGHILVASVISTPAAIAVAMMMIPPDRAAAGNRDREALVGIPTSPARSSMDAVTQGTVDGMQLLLNIVAMLLVLVALVSLANQILNLLPDTLGAPLTLQRMLGWLMAPLVWVMGVPWQEAPAAGALMGTKTVLNEFIAYIELARLPEGTLSPRSSLMMFYALCGFANLGSLGIMIGGLATMAPERRDDILALGPRTLISGTLATCIAGSVVGVLY